MNTPLEDELRALLHERADDVESTPDPWARTTRAIDADRRHHRRVTGGIAAVALAAVVGLGAALLAGPLGGDQATVPAQESSVRPPAGGERVPGSAPRLHLTGDTPLLAGVPRGWELVALVRRSVGVPFEVVRIEPASGRITSSRVPALLADVEVGVSLEAGAGQVLVHPGDDSPGYLLPRHGQAWKLTGGPLASGGPAFAGPRPGQVWLQDPDHPRRMRLIGFDGTPEGPVIQLKPGQSVGGTASDGSGYLIALSDDVQYGNSSPDGQDLYDVRPGGQRRVASGSLIATGPSRWLIRPCGPDEQCGLASINPRTGARQPLASPCPAHQRPATWPSSGTISPDGRTAAMFCTDVEPHNPQLYLLDLATGRAHHVDATLRGSAAGLVWSPNSRWLFGVDAGGRLVAVDRATGRPQPLPAGLLPLSQIAGD